MQSHNPLAKLSSISCGAPHLVTGNFLSTQETHPCSRFLLRDASRGSRCSRCCTPANWSWIKPWSCHWQAQLDVSGEGVLPWTEGLQDAVVGRVAQVAQAQQVAVVHAAVQTASLARRLLQAPAPGVALTLNVACTADAAPDVLSRLGQLYADADPAQVLPLGLHPSSHVQLLGLVSSWTWSRCAHPYTLDPVPRECCTCSCPQAQHRSRYLAACAWCLGSRFYPTSCTGKVRDS